ncbi:predicted protein [Arabidopsis lyrata subsp. lyrata]|uniref:Predicted protein n=1 Tax=Arabidopsis lyrata subsp. lyrata TaxID=81972 RepID=D7LD47_ARALL|nr:predicted protein [Arabidopsis lyrata subsp. lyrata]
MGDGEARTREFCKSKQRQHSHQPIYPSINSCAIFNVLRFSAATGSHRSLCFPYSLV